MRKLHHPYRKLGILLHFFKNRILGCHVLHPFPVFLQLIPWQLPLSFQWLTLLKRLRLTFTGNIYMLIRWFIQQKIIQRFFKLWNSERERCIWMHKGTAWQKHWNEQTSFSNWLPFLSTAAWCLLDLELSFFWSWLLDYRAFLLDKIFIPLGIYSKHCSVTWSTYLWMTGTPYCSTSSICGESWILLTCWYKNHPSEVRFQTLYRAVMVNYPIGIKIGIRKPFYVMQGEWMRI